MQGNKSMQGKQEINWIDERRLFAGIAEHEKEFHASIDARHPSRFDLRHVSRHDVVYLCENSDWIYGLPFGNGDIGGVVCFDTDLHVYVDKVDLWYDVGRPGTGNTGVDHYNGIRGGRIHAGKLDIVIPWLTQCDTVEQRLDLARGRVLVTAVRESWKITATITAHAQENRFRIEIDHPRLVDSFPHLSNFAMDRLEIDGPHQVLERRLGRQSYRVEVTPAVTEERRTVYDVVVVTEIDAQSDKDKIPSGVDLAARASAILERPWDQADHEEWWAEFWGRSAVCLPDEFFEQEWYLSAYITAITNRAQYPASFMGLWCFDEPVRMWGDLYVTDAQHPMSLWGIMPSNHLELMGPYFELYRDLKEVLEQTTAEAIVPGSSTDLPPGTSRYALAEGEKNRGLAMPKFVWPPWTGVDNPEHGLASSMKRGEKFTVAGAWIAKLMWQYFRHSGDLLFLRDIAYPFLKSVFDYIEGTLAKDKDGRIYDTSESPEQHGNTASAFGRGLVRMLLVDLIAAAEALDISGPEVTRYHATLEALAPYPIAADGAIAESVMDDHPLRCHLAVMTGVYPGGEIDVEHELADAARKTMEVSTRFYCNRDPHHAGILTAQAGGAELNVFNQTFSLLSHARLGNGNAVRDTLYSPTLRYLLLPHGGWCHNPGYRGRIAMETTGLPAFGAVVAEMLAQRRDDGTIHLFCAVPDDWKDIEFSRLRVEGGVVISAAMVGKTVDWVRVSAAYTTTVRLANPFGGAFDLEPATSEASGGSEGDGVIAIELAAGATATLIRQGAKSPAAGGHPSAAGTTATTATSGAGAATTAPAGPIRFSIKDAEAQNPIAFVPKPPPFPAQDFGDGYIYIGMPAKPAPDTSAVEATVSAATAALGDSDPGARQRALFRLAELAPHWPDPKALAPTLLKATADDDELVRATAVSTIKYLRDRADVREALTEIAQNDTLEAGRRARWILNDEPEDCHR